MKRLMYCLPGMLLVVGCQNAPPDEPKLSVQAAPIVNGQAETGYAPVGALTAWAGSDYYGSFCTGTLIRPGWVLTAAHCLVDETASQVRFYIGNNANNPNSGTFYRAQELKVHEQYNARTLKNDIALVRLQTPVTGTTPIAYNTTNLGPYEGEVAFYVGFGATEGINESGSGVKRSTSFPISDVFADSFTSNYAGTGTCFGDSGGPALLTIGGTLSIVGVTSAGAACSGANCDPCQTETFSTRIDAFSTWIASKLNEPAPNCNNNAAICGCAEACQANGSCDDSVCATDTCGDVYNCIVDCGTNGPCQNQCINSATATAQAQLNALSQCLSTNCDPNLSDQAYQQCAASNCAAETNACFGGGTTTTGSDTCSDITECFGSCSTEACYTACYGQGTTQAQGQIDTMYACFDARCANIDDETQWQTCISTNCGAELSACFGEQTSCNLAGGSCARDTACYPTTTEGYNGCFATAGKQVGAVCNPNASDLECVDGAACLNSGNGGVCARFCTTDSVCAGGVCNHEQDINGFGVCSAANVPCTDSDNDGACANVDCNDANPNVRPGATEACGNNIDDNCNGQVDENCATCTDNDRDGYCAEVDCNDGDPTVNSAANERCDDAIDNNCNGQIDEGCGVPNPDPDPDTINPDTTNPDGTKPEPTTPQGGNSSGGCAGGGELPLFAGLVALVVIAMRRRAVR